jgi:hypothetical protein
MEGFLVFFRDLFVEILSPIMKRSRNISFTSAYLIRLKDIAKIGINRSKS